MATPSLASRFENAEQYAAVQVLVGIAIPFLLTPAVYWALTIVLDQWHGVGALAYFACLVLTSIAIFVLLRRAFSTFAAWFLLTTTTINVLLALSIIYIYCLAHQLCGGASLFSFLSSALQ